MNESCTITVLGNARRPHSDPAAGPLFQICLLAVITFLYSILSHLFPHEAVKHTVSCPGHPVPVSAVFGKLIRHCPELGQEVGSPHGAPLLAEGTGSRQTAGEDKESQQQGAHPVSSHERLELSIPGMDSRGSTHRVARQPA